MERSLIKSDGFRPALLRAEWSDSGGRWNPGKASPAAAAACSECSRAAECSCALRRSSATEEERGSGSPLLTTELVIADRPEADEPTTVPPVCAVVEGGEDELHVGDEEEPVVVGVLTGQQEQSPGKAAGSEKKGERMG